MNSINTKYLIIISRRPCTLEVLHFWCCKRILHIWIHEFIHKCFRKCVPLVVWSVLVLRRIRLDCQSWGTRNQSYLKSLLDDLILILLFTLGRVRIIVKWIITVMRNIWVSSNFASDPKSFYDFVPAERKSSLFSTQMFYGDVSSSSYLDIANMFADPYLSSGFSYTYL